MDGWTDGKTHKISHAPTSKSVCFLPRKHSPNDEKLLFKLPELSPYARALSDHQKDRRLPITPNTVLIAAGNKNILSLGMVAWWLYLERLNN
jgi:hypothetical protein